MSYPILRTSSRVAQLGKYILCFCELETPTGFPANVERLKWLLIDRNGVSLVEREREVERKTRQRRESLKYGERSIARSVDKTRL